MPCSGTHATIGEQLPLQRLVGDRHRQWPRVPAVGIRARYSRTVLCEMPSSRAITRVLACAAEGSEYTLNLRWRLAPDGRLREIQKEQSTEYVRCAESDYR
jgi:hypothetical protein